MRLLLSSYSFFIKAPSAAVCKALISLVFYYHPYQSLAKQRLSALLSGAPKGIRTPGLPLRRTIEQLSYMFTDVQKSQ